jgi:hypothetical protein
VIQYFFYSQSQKGSTFARYYALLRRPRVTAAQRLADANQPLFICQESQPCYSLSSLQ